MSWAVAVASALLTGFLAYKTLSVYYRCRYRLKIESRGWSALFLDLIFPMWILSLGYAPSYVVFLVLPDENFYQSVLAAIIFGVFVIRAYLVFKKENPEIYRALRDPEAN
ncbi:hypothetical protein NUW46_06350 [Marinobacter sp. MA]|uniref:hypothetical protein n=1 Tax=Marinobacter sp. MA TaxID=2971606 RepID=UPI000AF2C54E